MFVARVLFIKEQLLFRIMNNIRAILPSSMERMLWILIVIWYIHNTEAKCRKTKGIPHMCGTVFGHIGETRMEKFHNDGFWGCLIMNHLTFATFLRKVKWLKYHSQAIRNEQRTYWWSYILMYVVRERLLLAVDFVYLQNDSSRYMDIYLIRRKSGSFEIIQKVFNMK